ncbi:MULTISPECIES: hypothetical protein [unclassified Chryseobacterium]|uniref:hypothetical protein n=1 Tax=unclassified Chryseobacterium TaxID=2593645 RepID=UPI00301B3401
MNRKELEVNNLQLKKTDSSFFRMTDFLQKKSEPKSAFIMALYLESEKIQNSELRTQNFKL